MSIVTSNFVLFSFSTDFPHKFPSRTYEPILINKIHVKIGRNLYLNTACEKCEFTMANKVQKYYANVNVDSAKKPVYLIIAIFERFFYC